MVSCVVVSSYASTMHKRMILTHWTAADFWEIPFLNQFFPAQLAHYGQEGTKQVIVFRRKERFRRKGYQVRCCTIPAMAKSYLLHLGTWVVPIEYVFLQLVNELDLQQGILLGNLMCSTRGSGLSPLTTREKLSAFVSSASWVRGHRKAKRALRYISDACRSPMEALTRMLLDLPHLLGGFKLGHSDFEFKIPIPPKYHYLTTKRNYIADIYYPSHRLIVEYYGREHELTREDDALRTQILEDIGYHVIVLDDEHLYPLKNFHSKLETIRHILQKRLQIRTKKFYERFHSLRKLLPRLSKKDYSAANRREEAFFLKQVFRSKQNPYLSHFLSQCRGS